MKLNRIVTAILMVNAILVGSASAAPTKQTEQVMHDYIINNPEVVVQSLQSYQQKQMDQAHKTIQKTQETASKFADPLFHQTNDPMSGNPNGKITVVEFFDYQCPHCVGMTPVMTGIVKSNPEVRVVYKEFPIRGPASEVASKAALAAHMQGKYLDFQHALMDNKQLPLTEEIIMGVAKTAGLDVEKLKTDMKGKEVAQQIKDTYKLAQNLQLMGTPAIFVAKSSVDKTSGPSAVVFVPGQVTQDQLQEVIGKIN